LRRDIEVSLKGDKEGMIGRECPSSECNKYFKVLIAELNAFKLGTFFCPYCGESEPVKEFITKDQMEYIKSLALREVVGEISRELKKLERRPDPHAFISFGIKVDTPSIPVRTYVERELSKKVTCEKCGREFRVYGTSFYCPYCGIRKPSSVFSENVEMVQSFVNFKGTLRHDTETLHAVSKTGILDQLVERSLDMLVTAFETYCKTAYIQQMKKKNPKLNIGSLQKVVKNAFQNLKTGNRLYARNLGINFLKILSTDDLTFALKSFQKRHVFVHNSGIIDLTYAKLTGEDKKLIGKRLTVDSAEINRLVKILNEIVEHIEKSI